jgi:hypothetical protein
VAHGIGTGIIVTGDKDIVPHGADEKSVTVKFCDIHAVFFGKESIADDEGGTFPRRFADDSQFDSEDTGELLCHFGGGIAGDGTFALNDLKVRLAVLEHDKLFFGVNRDLAGGLGIPGESVSVGTQYTGSCQTEKCEELFELHVYKLSDVEKRDYLVPQVLSKNL